MKQLGRYRLDAVEGVGAFATVWRGWDEELRVEVAVKVLADNWSHNPDVRERFLDEARILRRITDRRVVRVHDVGIEDGRPYFVMDYMSGGTVANLIGKVDTAEAIRVAAESALAVQALHDHGVLHRDIKPSNLLLDGADVRVGDLGSAKRIAEATGITVVTGTAAYMSPEQLHGQALDARSDIYALGVLTLELLTGAPPPPSPTRRISVATNAGKPIDDIVASAMSARPTDRPASAGAFANALQTALEPTSHQTISTLWVALLMVVGALTAFAVTWAIAR